MTMVSIWAMRMVVRPSVMAVLVVVLAEKRRRVQVIMVAVIMPVGMLMHDGFVCVRVMMLLCEVQVDAKRRRAAQQEMPWSPTSGRPSPRQTQL